MFIFNSSLQLNSLMMVFFLQCFLIIYLGRDRLKTLKIFLILISSVTFLACSPIHENLDDSSNASQSGNSIAAFSTSLFPLVTNNCGSCHGNNQSPIFAPDDATAAHNTLINSNLVDLDNPSNSRIVSKVNSGHQGFNSQLGDDFSTAISEWATNITPTE
jgi:hypothetical protein